MIIQDIEELIQKYQEEKKLLADEITLSIAYNKILDKKKINMVELNDKMYKLNRTIKQTNERIEREKNKETEKKKEVPLMNISLSGWINNIKDLFYDLEKTITTIREDYKGEIFDELQNNKQSAGIRAIGFMEDMNNIFADLKELKTDEEKLKWANNIKELLCVDELQYIKSDRTLIKKTQE